MDALFLALSTATGWAPGQVVLFCGLAISVVPPLLIALFLRGSRWDGLAMLILSGLMLVISMMAARQAIVSHGVDAAWNNTMMACIAAGFTIVGGVGGVVGLLDRNKLMVFISVCSLGGASGFVVAEVSFVWYVIDMMAASAMLAGMRALGHTEREQQPQPLLRREPDPPHCGRTGEGQHFDHPARHFGSPGRVAERPRGREEE